jgi:hypothetical protein
MAIDISAANDAARRWTCATLVPACRGRRINSGCVQSAVAISGPPIPHLPRRLRANRSQQLSRQHKHMPLSAIGSLNLDDEVDDDPDEDDDFDDDEDSSDDDEEDDADGEVETWQVRALLIG